MRKVKMFWLGIKQEQSHVYTNKCFTILNFSQFTLLNHDPTNKFERKLQKIIRKLKLKLPSNIYPNIYPSGSCPGKFYGTAKIHQMSPNKWYCAAFNYPTYNLKHWNCCNISFVKVLSIIIVTTKWIWIHSEQLKIIGTNS